MALRETIYGKVCPLYRFDVEVHGGGYTNDPVEACLMCNFSKADTEGFDLEKICQHPYGMNRELYRQTKNAFASSDHEKTKSEFWKFAVKTMFDIYTNQWKEHCKNKSHSSRIQDYINCTPYENLKKVGPRIIPFIKEELEKPSYDFLDAFEWSYLMHELIESYSVPEEIRGKLNDIREHAIKFLDDYLKE